MSALVTVEQCRRVMEQAARWGRKAGADGVEILIGGGREALTRFANNGIHQNVAEREQYLSVRAVVGQRTARAATNSLTEEAVRRVTEEAVALARASAPDKEMCPLLTPAEAGTPPAVARYDAATAETGPAARAEAVAEAIGIVRAAGQVAAGIYSTGESFEAVLNSEGVEAFHSETKAVFSITAMAADSSGWAKTSETSAGAIGTAALARRAAEKARLSAGPREIAPGRFTVILEPAAVLDLVGQIVPGFSATSVADTRSFLNDRLGQALFGTNIAITDDASHPLQSGAPFDGEGMARRPLTLVRAGTPLEVPYSRARARAEGKTATGHGLPLPNETGEMPANVVIAGGGASIEEMIRSTARGVLVTRVWYIREVDPYETIMTGMTRDGTFLIEGGEMAGGLKNFRFNHSIIELLKNVEALSHAARATGEETFDMVAPAMKVRDFPLSELTKF